MVDLQSRILSCKAKKDLTNDEIAHRMGALLHKPVSGDSVQKYFSNAAGIPLDNLGAFLTAMGLKVVSEDQEVISSEKLKALKLFALESLRSERD